MDGKKSLGISAGVCRELCVEKAMQKCNNELIIVSFLYGFLTDLNLSMVPESTLALNWFE